MKNLNKNIVLIVLFIATSITAQERLKGNKDVTTTNRELTDFYKIEVIDNMDVILSYNEIQNVSVTTDSNLQNHIITEINNGILTIKTSSKIVRSKELTIKVKINKNLKEISAYNSVNVKSSNILIIDSLKVNAYDDTDFNLKLNAKTVTLNSKKSSDLKVEILSDETYITLEESSSIKGVIDTKVININTLDKSDLNISGSTELLYLACFGNSAFKGKEFISKKAVVKTDNSSIAYINAVETVDIYAKNDSEVYVYSNPKIKLIEFYDKASLFKR